MRFINSFHNNLPANRKTKEIVEILRKVQNTLLADEEYEELIVRVNTIVDVGNALYPRTTKLWVRVQPESIAVALDGTDKSCWLGVATVKQAWCDIEKLLPR